MSTSFGNRSLNTHGSHVTINITILVHRLERTNRKAGFYQFYCNWSEPPPPADSVTVHSVLSVLSVLSVPRSVLVYLGVFFSGGLRGFFAVTLCISVLPYSSYTWIPTTTVSSSDLYLLATSGCLEQCSHLDLIEL